MLIVYTLSNATGMFKVLIVDFFVINPGSVPQPMNPMTSHVYQPGRAPYGPPPAGPPPAMKTAPPPTGPPISSTTPLPPKADGK